MGMGLGSGEHPQRSMAPYSAAHSYAPTLPETGHLPSHGHSRSGSLAHSRAISDDSFGAPVQQPPGATFQGNLANVGVGVGIGGYAPLPARAPSSSADEYDEIEAQYLEPTDEVPVSQQAKQQQQHQQAYTQPMGSRHITAGAMSQQQQQQQHMQVSPPRASGRQPSASTPTSPSTVLLQRRPQQLQWEGSGGSGGGSGGMPSLGLGHGLGHASGQQQQHRGNSSGSSGGTTPRSAISSRMQRSHQALQMPQQEQ